VRAHCRQIGERAEQGLLRHFTYHPEQLPAVAEYVVAEIVGNYPQGGIPIHGRLRHLDVGGIHRPDILRELFIHLSPEEIAKTVFELVVISVLLDGGAGSAWQYYDTMSERSWTRSEGLAVASFNMFMEGRFARDFLHTQVDGSALCMFSLEKLAAGLQVNDSNQLLGLQERCQLLRSLGQQVVGGGRFFPSGIHSRLGDLFSYMLRHGLYEGQAGGDEISAEFILLTLLEAFADIWPHGLAFAGNNLGDVGRYEGVRGKFATDGLVPFHKLSQWLTYSLLELFTELGVNVVDAEQLTGLPEYRNGGLLLDLGILTPKDPLALTREYLPGSELIVEWRAMTVYVLDLLAAEVRAYMGKRPEELSLGMILQGGTWSAGRRIAAQLRSDGSGPLRIKSDGTVF
jgi:hypothetical protein